MQGVTTASPSNANMYEAVAAVDETDAFEGKNDGSVPNMLFVPQRRSEPVVEAREFAVYIFLLVIFSVNISSMHFAEDQRVNLALKSVTNMQCLQKMSTFEDYYACYEDQGGIKDQLQAWIQSANTAFDSQGPAGYGLKEQKEAVMVGMPFIYQKRQTGRDVNYAGFNGTFADLAHGMCPWPMQMDDQMGDDSTRELACYTHFTPTVATGDLSDEMIYLPGDHIRGILNGTYVGWNPSHWYSREDTVQLGHSFMIYLPGMKRFASAHIVIYFDETGQASLKDINLNGQPAFDTFEPFLMETDPIQVYIELAFYCWMFYYLLCELLEFWDCVCMSELLLPFTILTDSMMLALLEIQYFHARTSEVYDPRDPKTGAAFTFPDVDDLEEHLKDKILPIKAEIHQLHKLLTAEKRKIMEKNEDTIEKDERNMFMCEMERIQMKLMECDGLLHTESFVADTAAILQLAVMWWNKWSMDFPPNALASIADDASVAEDGKEAFCSIDWVQVARAYTNWVDNSDEDHPEHPPHRKESNKTSFQMSKTAHTGTAPSITDVIGESTKATAVMATRFLKGDASDRAQLKPQHKRFAQLCQFVDYLQMLRDVLELHRTMVNARSVKYWNGPRIDLSNTIERAYQDMIIKYNDTGKDLMKQMEMFPDEIQAGFHEPNPTKAETIKVRAQSIQGDLQEAVETCGVLGFYFPGSPLWELQRRLREAGQYERSASFWLSLKPSLDMPGVGSGTVGYNSFQMYLDADLVNTDPRFKADGTAVTPADEDDEEPPVEDKDAKKKAKEAAKEAKAAAKKAGKKKKKKKKKKKAALSAGAFSNPMQQNFLEGSDEEDEGAAPELESELEEAAMSAPDEELSARKKADADLIFKGCPGWRDWIPESVKHLVTYDGQFTNDPDRGGGTKCIQGSMIYPLFLWVNRGFQVYLADLWNMLELYMYSMFMVSFYCKWSMLDMADSLKEEFVEIQQGDRETLSVAHYETLKMIYLYTLIPNSFLMWVKLFKYVDVIPQMGMLIQVLERAGMPVLIFSTVGLIPVVGMAFAYHAAFGQALPNYATVGTSLNTLLRMTVGDFDFVELTRGGNSSLAIPMFWITTMLLVFVLVNIFVAIILGSYDKIVKENPDANNSSEFVSMVIMQAKRTATRALGKTSKVPDDHVEPHILLTSLAQIEDETFWDIFEAYFRPGGHGIDGVMEEHAAELGGIAVGPAPAPRGDASSRGMPGQEMSSRMDSLEEKVGDIALEQHNTKATLQAIVESQQHLTRLIKKLGESGVSGGTD